MNDFKNPIVRHNIASQIEYRQEKITWATFWIGLVLLIVGLIILLISFNATKRQQSSIREVKSTGAIQARLAVVGKDTNKKIRLIDTSKVWASWYGKEACGKRIYGTNCKTANGEIFNENSLTIAHRTLPFDTSVKFTYNGNTVTCRVNDRGPFVKDRTFDLSKGCAQALGMTGVKVVKYEIVNYE